MRETKVYGNRSDLFRAGSSLRRGRTLDPVKVEQARKTRVIKPLRKSGREVKHETTDA